MKKKNFIILTSLLTIAIIFSLILFLIKPPTFFMQKVFNNIYSKNSKTQKNYNIKEENENKENENRKIRIMIDAGHNAVVKGSKGILGEEYILTYKVAKLIGQYFSNDKRFEYLLSRDENYYIDVIKDYAVSNKSKLEEILNTKLDFDKRAGYLNTEQTYELYSIRHYAIDNNFDLLISIHFDYTPNKKRMATTKGFQTIVSPYNKEFIASIQMAKIIASNMKNKYRVATGINFDKSLPSNIWDYYSKEDLTQKGIALRSIVVLGDAFEYEYYKNKKSEDSSEKLTEKDIPSVLIEAAYIHEADFKDEKNMADIAHRIYKSITQIFFE